MKKIFIIEINDKDKIIDSYNEINDLDEELKRFNERLQEKNIFVRLKRVGKTWNDILENANKNISKKEAINDQKTNHLKLIK